MALFIFCNMYQNLHMLCFQFQIKEWIDLFSQVGERRTGYCSGNVTCYMHAAAYHVPTMVQKHENIKQFSGQGKYNKSITIKIYIRIQLSSQ